MAQRIITLCDAHALHDAEAPGVQWEVTITAPGAKPTAYAIDLCDDDAKPLRDLLEFLAEAGRRAVQQPGKPARKSGGSGGPTGSHPATVGSPAAIAAGVPTEGPVPCPVDGCDMTPVSVDALGSHLRAHHDTSIAEVYGLPTPYACDVDGCSRRFTHPQGLGAHKKATHGVPGTASH